MLAALGALLVAREGGRPIGQLLVGGACAYALSFLGGGYVALGRAQAWPAVDVVDRVSGDAFWAFAVIPLTTVLLAVFPDGRRCPRAGAR